MPNDKEFAALVLTLRQANAHYFATRKPADLQRLREIEGQVDAALAEMLPNMGAGGISLDVGRQQNTPAATPPVKDFTPPAGRKYLFEDDLVRITGIPKTTWQKWRSQKTGPAYIKRGRRPAYPPEEVEKWEARQHVKTS